MSALLVPALTGFLIGAGLIVAIGAQNAFVLRQGLLRQHVLAVVLVCALSDALLIALGVGGMGAIVTASPLLLRIATWGGALFLATYGLLALRRAFQTASLRGEGDVAAGLGQAVTTCLAFTFLNPHVYLDTVVLVGSLSGQFAGPARLVYAAGAAAASFLWFFGLGYGARFLAPLFARPIAWRILDLFIAAAMLLIAWRLVLEATHAK